jgi:hypothetical protein
MTDPVCTVPVVLRTTFGCNQFLDMLKEAIADLVLKAQVPNEHTLRHIFTEHVARSSVNSIMPCFGVLLLPCFPIGVFFCC